MDKVTRQFDVTRNGVRYTVDLVIDVDAVAKELVNNAARNTSGKAGVLGGAIKATVVDRKKVSA